MLQAHPPADPAAYPPLLNLLSLPHLRSLAARAAAPNASSAATGLSFLPSDSRAGAARAAVSAAAPLRGSADPSAAPTGLLVFTVMWDHLLSLALPSTPGLDLVVSCAPPDPSANADVGPAAALGASARGEALFSLRSGPDGVSSYGAQRTNPLPRSPPAASHGLTQHTPHTPSSSSPPHAHARACSINAITHSTLPCSAAAGAGWGDALPPRVGRFRDLRSTVRVAVADAAFTLSVRPTEDFYRSSLGNTPIDITIGVGVVFATFLLLFTVSDCVTRRRNHKLSLFFAYKTAQNAADRQAMR